MKQLDQYRLIYLAPASGVGGVGDYADDFADAARPHFGEVVEYRHGAPGSDTVSDILRHRKAIQQLIDEAPGGNALVHCEFSGGSVMAFWATRGLPVPVTATVHDPPGLVWWPARTKFLAGNRILNHGLHFPLRGLSRRVERRVAGDRTLFALTRAGADSLRQDYSRADVRSSVHFVTKRPTIPHAEDRPRAIGLFGLVYRGKGFELIEAIRANLPDDILIRVAGRGTETLPSGEGIDIVGEVNGTDEDDFFASIRALVVPYGKRLIYGEVYPASGVVTRAIAYETPLVCLGFGALVETQDDGGSIVVDGGGHELAAAAAALVDDETALKTMRGELEILRRQRTPEHVITDFLDVWSQQ